MLLSVIENCPFPTQKSIHVKYVPNEDNEQFYISKQEFGLIEKE